MLQVDIQLDADKDNITYKNCDTIKGVVGLNILQRISLQHLKVKLVTRTKISYLCEYNTVKSKHVAVEEKLIVTAQLLPNFNSKVGHIQDHEIDLEEGVYYYPFSFRIPMVKRCKHCNAVNELIPLFEMPEVTSVNYYIRVSIDGLNLNRFRAYKRIEFMPVDTKENGNFRQLSALICTGQYYSNGAPLSNLESSPNIFDFLEDSDCLSLLNGDVDLIWCSSNYTSSMDTGSMDDYFSNLSDCPLVDAITCVKAVLDEKSLIPSRILPLDLSLGHTDEPRCCKVYLQGLLVELVVYTKFLISNENLSCWSTITHSVPLYYRAPDNLECPLTQDEPSCPFELDNSLVESPQDYNISRELYGNIVIPPEVVPTFHSCKLSRSYSLNITVGFTGEVCENREQLEACVQNLKFTFDDVHILSGYFQ